ncbi:hypothetical protein DRJ24_05645 [Candidatus Acetothermia bacterium]|nr:MAG: hypothetical protein DRJ24_05645 [Candidatus Acetothermia bacterium]
MLWSSIIKESLLIPERVLFDLAQKRFKEPHVQLYFIDERCNLPIPLSEEHPERKNNAWDSQAKKD